MATELKLPAQLADGIYFGLPNDDYHADSAVGSTDIRNLLKGPNRYWYTSGMNPKRPPVKSKRTEAKVLGDAVHKLLLEGHKVFDHHFVRGPYSSDSDLTSAEKSALTKAAKAKLLTHQELLSADHYEFALNVKNIIDRDPRLEGCLDGGYGEVSVFWTAGGMRLKSRFDKLKLRGIGDIKTIANERDRAIEDACRLDIKTYRYDIQARHYLEGRAILPALVTAGRFFHLDSPTGDETKARLEFLRQLRDREFAFQFVFIPKTNAPDAWSCVLSPGNPILERANEDIATAMMIYRDAVKLYGFDEPWMPNREVAELDENDLPMSFGRRG